MGYETPARVLGLTDENFDIAIGFQYAGKNKSITPVTIDQYFSYTLSQINYGLITDPNLIASYGSSYYWNKTVIPLALCDPTRFLGMSDIANNLGITNTMYCPDLEDYTLNLTGGFSTQTA